MNRIAILPLVGVAACSATAPKPQPADTTFRVSLNRAACFGSCPVYRVEIASDGLVKFTGSKSVAEPSVPCQGARQWRIAPAAVRRLEDFIDRSGFFDLNQSAYRAKVTDQPTFYVAVTRNGRTKSVEDYAGRQAGMPAVVGKLEEEIDAAAADRECVVAHTAAVNSP
jgi:hypothetical protein